MNKERTFFGVRYLLSIRITLIGMQNSQEEKDGIKYINQWDKYGIKDAIKYINQIKIGAAFQITEEMVHGKLICNLTGLQSQAKLNNSMMSSTKKSSCF